MKKLVIACLSLGLAFMLTGCSIGSMLDQFLSVGDTPVEEPKEIKERVYMDEIKGILHDFTGSTLTLQTSEELTYIFDISQASLECVNGMITGDEVTVIYEGRLPEGENQTDTSAVQVLKVVDDYRMHTDLTVNATSGLIQNLTANTITLNTGDGTIITFPTTGCEQYFSGGIRPDVKVTIHYLGDLENTAADSKSPYNAFHVKAVSISDIEPYASPAPTPTPDPKAQNTSAQTIQAVIRDVQMNVLTVVLSDGQTELTLDLSGVPAYFKGGPSAGSRITITYHGPFDGSTINGISILSVIGEDPATLKEYRITSYITGIIQSRTQNTLTLLTADGIYITFRIDDADNQTTGGLEIGDGVRITFNPEENRTTNVYSCLRLEDA